MSLWYNILKNFFRKALKSYWNCLIIDVSNENFRNVTSGGRLRGLSGFIKCLLKPYQKGNGSYQKYFWVSLWYNIFKNFLLKALKRYWNCLIDEVSDNIFRNVTSGGRAATKNAFIFPNNVFPLSKSVLKGFKNVPFHLKGFPTKILNHRRQNICRHDICSNAFWQNLFCTFNIVRLIVL